MRRYTFILLSIFWFNTVFAAVANKDPRTEQLLNQSLVAVQLTPEPKHPEINRLITGILLNYHYQKPVLDDAFSSRVLDHYLNILDPTRSYFLASDIKQLETYRNRLDESLKQGDLSPAYEIFNLFQKRWQERYDYSLTQIKSAFDLKTDEVYAFDRDKKSPWITSVEAMNDLWRKRVKNDVLLLKLAKKKDEDIRDLLTKRYNMAKRHMVQSKSEDVFWRYMNAYTEAVEPHTNYLSPRSAEQFDIEMKLSFEGIGAVLQTEEVYTKVVRILPAGPADKTKQIFAEDKVVGVGQGDKGPMVDVVGWRLDDVVDLIRGPANSWVRLEVLPAKSAADGVSKVVTLKREKIKLEEQAAKSKIVQVKEPQRTYKIGVIELPKFYIDFPARAKGDVDYRSTTKDVKRLLEQLQRDKVDGVVVDLRNNGGGALIEAAQLTGLFIPEGPIVQERKAYGKIDIIGDDDGDISYKGPMLVLVNRLSASASEIFAAAIQDYGRGLIVGEPTFGKGTVQQIFDLNRMSSDQTHDLGQVKFTLAKFYRINGGSTQHKGVEPDIKLPSLLDPNDFGESTEETALPWDQIPATRYKSWGKVADLVPELNKRHEQRIKKDPDFQDWLADIADYQRQKQQKTVSLQEAKRIQERDENTARALARENARRKRHGLPAVASLEDLKPEEQTDAVLQESTHILADWISVQTKNAAHSS